MRGRETVLDAAQEARIVRLHEDGVLSIREIALRYHVSKEKVERILRDRARVA